MTNPKPPLQPGDRVRVHFLDGSTAKGVIKEILPNGYLKVFIGKNRVTYPHPMQCRRLRKKEKPPTVKRVEYWLVLETSGEEKLYLTKRGSETNTLAMRTLHLVELRKGESICPKGSVPVDREKLAKAWEGARSDEYSVYPKYTTSKFFPNLCKALNLPETK